MKNSGRLGAVAMADKYCSGEEGSGLGDGKWDAADNDVALPFSGGRRRGEPARAIPSSNEMSAGLDGSGGRACSTVSSSPNPNTQHPTPNN